MFRTPLIPVRSHDHIDIHDRIILMGSCFAENIGGRLSLFKFNTLLNPFGVIYNPISILKLFNESLNQTPIDQSLIVQNQEVFRHFDFHSTISSLNKEELLKKASDTFQITRERLGSAQWIILSLGTSIVYKLKNQNRIIANCHKLPQSSFDRDIISVDDISRAFQSFYETLITFNPGVKIILTVSPVRHLKDTHQVNSLSKSILRVAANEITSSCKNTSYFPSYEIMMDDLRDYRFYNSDMLHPNEDAIDYIWQLFIDAYFNDRSKQFIKGWAKIINAFQHKPFNPGSKLHKQFVNNTITQLISFKSIVDISEELRILEDQLNG